MVKTNTPSQTGHGRKTLIFGGGALSFLLILVNSQIFYGASTNPIGIDGVQEAFDLLLVLWGIGSIVIQQLKRGRIRKMDVYVLLLVLVPSIYGAIAAKFTYGQPIFYGLLEERRIFAVLIYFPVRTMFARNWVDMDGFHTIIVVTAAICAILSIGIILNIVPTLQEINRSEIALRSERVSVGAGWIAFAIPILVSSRASFLVKWKPLLLILLVGTLVAIIQSRQLILISAIATIFILRGPRALLMILSMILVATAAVTFIPFLNERVMVILQLFQEIGSNDYLSGSWRALSYNHVFESFSGAPLGHGSLSNLWQDGFARVIGNYFFLADIGVVGTLFRYGLIGLLFYTLWFALQFQLLRAIPVRRYRVLYSALFLSILLSAPVGAPLEYRGFLAGLILGATAYLASLKRNGGVV